MSTCPPVHLNKLHDCFITFLKYRCLLHHQMIIGSIVNMKLLDWLPRTVRRRTETKSSKNQGRSITVKLGQVRRNRVAHRNQALTRWPRIIRLMGTSKPSALQQLAFPKANENTWCSGRDIVAVKVPGSQLRISSIRTSSRTSRRAINHRSFCAEAHHEHAVSQAKIDSLTSLESQGSNYAESWSVAMRHWNYRILRLI